MILFIPKKSQILFQYGFMDHLIRLKTIHLTLKNKIMGKKNVICFSVIFYFFSCTTWDTKLVLVNNTGIPIRYLYELKTNMDTIPDLSHCQSENLYDIQPYSEQIIRSPNKWDVYFRKHHDDILRVYVINEDSLLKYGTCGVLKRQIFLKRFDYDYDSLKKINWRIVFDAK